MASSGSTSTRSSTQEEEPGLGNGGLGRLAACFMDSLATLADPGHRLRHPLRVRHLRPGDPRRLAGRDHRQVAPAREPLGGRPPRDRLRREASAAAPRRYTDETGRYRVRWIPARVVKGVAYDTPDRRLPGRTTRTCSASGRPRPPSRSTSRRSTSATTTAPSRQKVALRERSPRSSTRTTSRSRGKALRLEQQHFFVSCSLQDMIRIYLQATRDLSSFAREVRRPAQRHAPGRRGGRADAPSRRRARDRAGTRRGTITRQTFAYTNHTLLPEALEKWPVVALRQRRSRGTSRSSTRSTGGSSTRCATRFPGDDGLARAALADRRGRASAPSAWRTSRAVGSHAINGVAALHTELLKRDVLARLPRALAREVHERDQRRHAAALRRARQPGAGRARLARRSATAGSRDLERLPGLEPLAEDAAFRERVAAR